MFLRSRLLAIAPIALIPALAVPAALDSGPLVGQHAPEHGLTAFAGSWDAASGQVVKKSRGGTQGSSRTEAELSDLRGDVVIVHAFAWEDPAAVEQTLPLIRDLLQSNEHRHIAAIAIVRGEQGDAVAQAVEAHGLSWPVALAAEGEDMPYFAPQENGTNHVFLVGRSGEIAWRGDPFAEQDAFLAAVGTALRRDAAPALGRDLRPELAEARAAYYAGEWEKARVLAEKAAKKHEAGADEAAVAIVEDARLLLETIDEHSHDLRSRAREAMSQKQALPFYEVRFAVDRGFPRTPLQKELKELAKEIGKDLSGLSFPDTERWFELRDEQPVLFPARKSGEGDRFAKQLEKYVRSTVNVLPTTQLARRLLEAYGAAR